MRTATGRLSRKMPRAHTQTRWRGACSRHNRYTLCASLLYIFLSRHIVIGSATIVLLNVDYELFYVNKRVPILFIGHWIAADCDRNDVDGHSIRAHSIPFHFGFTFFFVFASPNYGNFVDSSLLCDSAMLFIPFRCIPFGMCRSPATQVLALKHCLHREREYIAECVNRVNNDRTKWKKMKEKQQQKK